MTDNIHTPTESVLMQTLQVPAAITATANSGSVNVLGYRRAMFVLEVGAVTGTTPTLNVTLQESPDNATWVNVTNGAYTQITATQTGCFLMNVDLAQRQQYLRLVNTLAGTTPSYTMGEHVALFGGMAASPTQENTPVSV